MGYTLEIGEAKVDWTTDCVRIGVNEVRLDKAPAFGEPTDHTNARWPSYTAWADFCEQLHIRHIMFSERNCGQRELQVGEHEWIYPLLDEHPGAQPITAHHLRIVAEQHAAYRRLHPTHRAELPPLKPEFCHQPDNFHPDSHYVEDPTYDVHLCRAMWLEFWLDWALQNCRQPVFVNR